MIEDEGQEAGNETVALQSRAAQTAEQPVEMWQEDSVWRYGGMQREEGDESRLSGVAALAIILGQLIAYFSGRAGMDDLDILSFCLHHLFCRGDFLYRAALSSLERVPVPELKVKLSPQEWVSCQHMWMRLRAIKHILQRLGPLCQLLNEATAYILDALDMTVGLAGEDAPGSQASVRLEGEQGWLQVLNQERWDSALAALSKSLGHWQESPDEINLFVRRFSGVAPDAQPLKALDNAFNVMLASAGVIFGEIVPGFQAISVGDDEAVSMLLFDLMQQVDQLLLECAVALELLEPLLELFAAELMRSD